MAGRDLGEVRRRRRRFPAAARLLVLKVFWSKFYLSLGFQPMLNVDEAHGI